MRAGAMPGLVIATVVDNDDPEGQGRIKVTYPWLDETLESDWVPIASPFAGPDRGLYMMPEPDDEMIVGFLHGDFNRPVVLGALWNGQSEVPSADPRQRMIRSVNGHTIRFVDSTPSGGDYGALIIEDRHKNYIVMSNTHMLVRAVGTLILDGATVVIKGRTVEPSANTI
jgi:uncharacterized protein involved in type VI secretion and phage assembly